MTQLDSSASQGSAAGAAVSAAVTDMGEQPLRIVGAPGSPYSRKLRAVLRYRRIPYAWINQGSPESRGLPQPRVQLLPQLILAGRGRRPEARTDSTPLIRELETLPSRVAR